MRTGLAHSGRGRILTWVLLAVFLQGGGIGNPEGVLAGTSSRLMDLSADGRLLVCSNRDSGTISVVDLDTMTRTRELPVGCHPEGVTFVGETHQVAVAVHGDDLIRFIDVDTGSQLGTLEVFDEPYGIISDPDGRRLWATLDYPGELLEIDPETHQVLRSCEAGDFLRGIARTAEGKILVTEYLTGVVKCCDPASMTVVDEWVGSPQDNLARQIVCHPLRPKAYVPHQRSLTTVAHGSGSIFPYLSVIDTEPGEGKRRKRVQMDSFRGTYVVANPWDAALTPDGKTLFVVFSGTDDLFVCRVLDDDYRELEYGATIRTGSNPRAVVVTPDGRRALVYNALDFTVTAIDVESLKPDSLVIVSQWPGDLEALQGKKLFYTANPPMTSRRWIACSSCHPDGDSDGRTWQQPEGLRSTQPLFGLKQTHPIHWSADRDEVQDFEHTIRSPLMQGRGLIRGAVNDSLGEPNAGRSAELDALAAYTNSHEFRLSPHARNGLSAAAERGRLLFADKTIGCADCHSGDWYTDRQLHDVGTGEDDPTEKIGPLFDTPTLLGIYRSAPYLHHGKAATLEEVLTTANPQDRHGRTSQLKPEEIADLVEFLKCLPFERP